MKRIHHFLQQFLSKNLRPFKVVIALTSCLWSTWSHADNGALQGAIKETLNAITQGDFLDAAQRLQRIEKEYRNHSAVAELAAWVHFHQNDFNQRCASLGLSLGALDGAILENETKSLIQATCVLALTMHSKESAHFRAIFTPGKDEILADLLLPLMEAMRARLVPIIAPELGEERVLIMIVNDGAALAKISGLPLRAIETTGTIAICKFNRLMVISPLATLKGYDWISTLTHEYVHLIINRQAGPGMPLWLHEGLAKHYEAFGRIRSAQKPEVLPLETQTILAQAARKGVFISFGRMEPSLALLPSPQEAALAYAETALFVQLLIEKEKDAGIRALLRALKSGSSFEVAIKRVYRSDIQTLQAEFSKRMARYKSSSARLFTLPIQFKSAKNKTSEPDNDASVDVTGIHDQEILERFKLGALLEKAHRLAAASVEYGQGVSRLKRMEAHPPLVYRYARTLTSLGRLSEAQKILLTLSDQDDRFVDAEALLGEISLKLKNYALASVHFSKALMINPFISSVHEGLLSIPKNLTGQGDERLESDFKYLNYFKK